MPGTMNQDFITWHAFSTSIDLVLFDYIPRMHDTLNIGYTGQVYVLNIRIERGVASFSSQ